jgi:hypothetical protein
VSDLLAAAADSPLLLAILVIGGFVVWAIEHLAGANGPITRGVRAWQDRELRRLQREADLQTARRRAVQESDDARVAELLDEVAWLREQLRRTRRGEPDLPPDTEPIPTTTAMPAAPPPPADRRNSGRHRPRPR